MNTAQWIEDPIHAIILKETLEEFRHFTHSRPEQAVKKATIGAVIHSMFWNAFQTRH